MSLKQLVSITVWEGDVLGRERGHVVLVSIICSCMLGLERTVEEQPINREPINREWRKGCLLLQASFELGGKGSL